MIQRNSNLGDIRGGYERLSKSESEEIAVIDQKEGRGPLILTFEFVKFIILGT
jgi:hypothetical protein